MKRTPTPSLRDYRLVRDTQSRGMAAWRSLFNVPISSTPWRPPVSFGRCSLVLAMAKTFHGLLARVGEYIREVFPAQPKEQTWPPGPGKCRFTGFPAGSYISCRDMWGGLAGPVTTHGKRQHKDGVGDSEPSPLHVNDQAKEPSVPDGLALDGATNGP
jgi:hypothetical protein